MSSCSLVWFRQDLRLHDNPALQAALARGGSVIPVFIRSPDEEGRWRPGQPSDWWLHQSLRQLDKSLRERGSKLVLRVGSSLEALSRLASETGANAIFWNRRYEPASIARDMRVKSELRTLGLAAESFNAQLLFEPWEIQTKEGRPYQVFTAFWRTCLAKDLFVEPVTAPNVIPSPPNWPVSLKLDALQLEATRPWTNGLRDAWQPGCDGAERHLQMFLDNAVTSYATVRDIPCETGTSRLSPHLHFGEISPRAVWHAVQAKVSKSANNSENVGPETYLKELGWREFAHHLLYHFPTTTEDPLRPEFGKFPWEENKIALRAWQRGLTGYPIVDAGMRELWATGWMHNRVRMIVASFLVKDLRIRWQHGAAWFWDTLVDADLANNTLGWQWSAGCGADAAPYFRVFNPVLQSEKFDSNGDYIRRWIPELATLATKWLHAPWTAPTDVLKIAGIKLGQHYPQPIVDHNEARKLALQAFERIKRSVH